MTRETKIGLLVGLAFMIVIGILLSQYLSSTNEPQQPAWAGAGANVRDGVTTPGGSDPDGPPVTIAGAAADAPRRPVPTHDDLRAASPPAAFASTAARAAAAEDAPVAPGARPPGGTPVAPGPAPLVPNPVDPPAARLPRGARELVLQHPDDLTPVDPGTPVPPARPAPAAPAPAAPAPAGAPYTAVAGDNVSHMASRLMGGNTRANRDLLIQANPPLQAEGNPVVVGRTYLIPRPGRTPPAAPPAGGADRDPADFGRGARADRAAPAQWYTVKGNDNLWRIAEAQLGNGNAWTLIRDLNKDVLRGGETVHANMRLRLPPRSAVAGVE